MKAYGFSVKDMSEEDRQMQHMPHPVDLKEMNVGSHCGIGRVYSHIPF